MVKSVLDPNINYPEIKALDKEDEDFEVSPWNIGILDMVVKIALGKSKYRFIDKNIVFFPIYLINKNDEVVMQIGIYEIKNTDVLSVIDDEGHVDLDNPLIKIPLLYSFVTKELLENKEEKKDSMKEDKDDDSVVDEDNDSDSIVEKETEETYDEAESDVWIKKYLQNNNYEIEDNEGGGDCLFSAIRDGLKTVDKEITVSEMRKKLADEVTEDVFEGYLGQYIAIKNEYKQNIKKLSKLSSEHSKKRKELENTKDRNIQAQIIEKADNISKEYEDVKFEKLNAKELLEEFNFMKGITTIEAFKAKIQTCDFWGETWALSTLERVLNVKFILFSKEAFDSQDFDNVLQCGQLNDTILEEKGSFKPEYYIILEYLGYHYELITYKNKGALTFKELPYDIKKLIVDNCLDGSSGPYYIIPEFHELINKSNKTAKLKQDSDETKQDDKENLKNLEEEKK